MRTSRLKLTNLIKTIKESLDDGDDIYGYSGINKSMLIDSLSESYKLLSCFEEYNNLFEVTFMKRKVASIIDRANHYLKETSINSDNFNEFLNIINRIRFEIKFTYILVSQSPLRLDIAISDAKKDLAELTKDIEEIRDLKTEIQETSDTANDLVDTLNSSIETVQKNNQVISESIEKINAAVQTLSAKDAITDEWKENIEECKEQIANNTDKIKELLAQLDKASKTISIQQGNIDEQINKQATIQDTNQKQQEEIKTTLEGANKHGMAGSFYTRKEELKLTLRFWQWATILSIIGLIVGAIWVVKPIIENPGNFTTMAYLARIPILAALVWLGWFCSKQYGYTTRIREDYSYKYAISMAFEGYKKQANNVNEDLLNNLLELTINSVGKSPVTIYDTKNNHGTPMNEIVDKLADKVIDPILGAINKSES